MYTLGIPDRQKRRTLGYLKQRYVDFEENPSIAKAIIKKTGGDSNKIQPNLEGTCIPHPSLKYLP